MTAGSNAAGRNALVDGVTVTAGNNTGGGNVALGVAGSGIVKRVSRTIVQPPSDSAWYEWAAKAAAGGYFSFTPGTLVPATGGAAGAWFMFTGVPTSGAQVLRFGNSGVHGSFFTSAGKFALYLNSVFVYTSAFTPSLNVPYWLSHASNSSATAGQASMGIWAADGSLIESFTSASNLDTSAITNANCAFGKINGAGNMAIYRVADMRGNNDANALISAPPDMGGRWGIAA